MASTKQLLEDEIRKEIEEISNMELGSDNQKKTTDNLVKLLDKYNDMDKLDADLEKHDTEIEMKKAEHELKKQQLEHEKKDSFVKNCLTGISIGSGIIMTVSVIRQQTTDGLLQAHSRLSKLGLSTF